MKKLYVNDKLIMRIKKGKGYVMKKILIKLFIVVIILSITAFVGQSYANNNSELELKEAEYSERYQNWLNLNDEEKENTIEPIKYDIITSRDNTSYLKSTNNIFKTYQMLKASVADKSYNLKNDIPENVKVRNQQKANACWAFATIGALESHLGLDDKQNSRATTEYDFSESHMDYATIRSGAFLNNEVNEYGYSRKLSDGGTLNMATQYLANGLGAVDEKDFPFIDRDDSIGEVKEVDISNVLNQDVKTTLYDTVVFSEDDPDLMQKMKQHIINYGGISAMVHGANAFSGDYYNNETGAMYCNSEIEEPVDHAVTIIGWDDDYAVENFNENQRPTSKGAWIIKNSWGDYMNEDLSAIKEELYNALKDTNNWTSVNDVTDEIVMNYSKIVYGESKVAIEGDKLVVEVGNEGYMYISYEDCNVYSGLMGIEKAEYGKNYDNVYQNDELGPNGNVTTNANQLYIANVFDRNSGVQESLDKVSIYTYQEYTNCKVYVNPKGNSKDVNNLQEIKLKEGDTVNIEPGYHVLEFEEPIALTGNSFAVVLQVETSADPVQIALEYKDDRASSGYQNVVVNEGESFLATVAGFQDNVWTDLATGSQINAGNATIKAYTTLGTEQPDTPTTPEEPGEQTGKPVPSNFDSASSKITDAKVYFNSADLEKSTVEITIKIAGIKIGDETNTYKYYYHLSGTQGDENITDWKETTIQKESDGTYSITLNINSNDLTNIDEISESDNLYVYIREIAQANGEEVENVYTLETNTQIDPVFYIDGELIGGAEDILGLNGNGTNNNGSVQGKKDDTVSSKVLPFAGSFTFKIIVILAIIAFGGFAYYRYKNIDK